MIRHDRSLEHYARVERCRQPGETFLDALRRLAITDAVADCGTQQQAAALLGLSPRMVNFYARKLALPCYKGRPRRRRLEIVA